MTREAYQLLEAHMLSCMGDSAHDKEHIYRVLYSALDIAQGEAGVDYDVLIAACLLHDIARGEQFADPAVCHARRGAERARTFLLDPGFGEDFARRVSDCIRTHRYRSEDPPASLEARILFDADKLDVTGAVGIARTFQNIRLFGNLTVFENVLIAKHMRAKQNVFSATFRLNRKEEERMRREAMELLELQGMAHLRDEIASSLPYGLQRRVEIARALATDPTLLLLDEPVSGIDQNGMELFYRTMVYLKENFDLSVILISHDLEYVVKYADKVILMDKTILKEGSAKEVFASSEFQEVFGAKELPGYIRHRGRRAAPPDF